MEEWVIHKGLHSSLSNFWLRFFPRIGHKPVTYRFMFLKDDWYPFKDPDDLDINKLAGFSYGWHHKNSVRIGWTPMFSVEGMFTLYFYIYNNGERITKTFANISSGTEYELEISLHNNKVVFDMKQEKSLQSVKADENFTLPKTKIGYFLWFYFGGNKRAPKKMTVYLKKN